MAVQSVRIISVFVLLVLGLAFGIIPLLQKVSHANREYFGLANAGAGGVFLGSGLLHMLADSQNGFAKLGLNGYPWALLLMGCGFFSTMIIELFLSPGHEAIIELGGGAKSKEEPILTTLPAVNEFDEEQYGEPTPSMKTNTNVGCEDPKIGSNNERFSGSPSSLVIPCAIRSYTEPIFTTFLNYLPSRRARSLSLTETLTSTREERQSLLTDKISCDNVSPGPFRRQAQKNCVRQCWKSTISRKKIEETSSTSEKEPGKIRVRYYSRMFETGFETAVKLQDNSCVLPTHKTPALIFQDDDEEQLTTSKVTAIIFVIILSLHSFITGLATGSSEASLSDYTIIFLALCVHKIVAAMSLGIAVKKASWTIWKGSIYIAIFSISTPIGVACGLLIASNLENTTIKLAFTSVAMAIGSGSFVYLAIMENIVEEFVESRRNRKCKLAMTLLGFGLMSGLAYFD